jgi:hypothetical protein
MDNEPVLCKPGGECEFCKERGIESKKFLWVLSVTTSGTTITQRKGFFCSFGHFFWEGGTASEKIGTGKEFDIGTGSSPEINIGTGSSPEIDIGTGSSQEEFDIGTGSSQEEQQGPMA